MPSIADGVLVEAGGQAERAVHAQPERLGPQRAVAGCQHRGANVRRPGTRAASRIHRKARWWACSASILRKTSLKKREYMRFACHLVVDVPWRGTVRPAGAPSTEPDGYSARASARRAACSWRERTPMSPRFRASMPWTAAASAWTVVRHGTPRATAAVRMS